MKKIKLFEEFFLNEDRKELEKELRFAATEDGIIEVLKGEARSAEVKKGDIFIAKAETDGFYEGELVLSHGTKFSHQPGLSGRKTDTTPKDWKYPDVIFGLRKRNLNGENPMNSFAQFEDEMWTDPAGGEHYWNEEDPASMYESQEIDKNYIKKELNDFGKINRSLQPDLEEFQTLASKVAHHAGLNKRWNDVTEETKDLGNRFFDCWNGSIIDISIDEIYDALFGTNAVKENMYAMLGGETPFINSEMCKKVVEPNLGKDFDTYIMFDDDKEKANKYSKLKKEYPHDITKKWKSLYRSSSYQGHAEISPDGNIISASILGRGGIIGVFYVKKGFLKESFASVGPMIRTKEKEIKYLGDFLKNVIKNTGTEHEEYITAIGDTLSGLKADYQSWSSDISNGAQATFDASGAVDATNLSGWANGGG